MDSTILKKRSGYTFIKSKQPTLRLTELATLPTRRGGSLMANRQESLQIGSLLETWLRQHPGASRQQPAVLPSAVELADHFGCSPFHVLEALNGLRSEGYDHALACLDGQVQVWADDKALASTAPQITAAGPRASRPASTTMGATVSEDPATSQLIQTAQHLG